VLADIQSLTSGLPENRLLPGVNLLGALWVVGGGVTWAIVFIVMAPKHDASFIFTEFINNTGYASNGWVFIMAFYNSMYGMVGTDGMMHLVSVTGVVDQRHF
jgi:choline transport protein